MTEDGQPQEFAFVEFQRLATTVAPAAPPPPAAPVIAQSAPAVTGVASSTQTEIASLPAGDIRYRDWRLLVLYFDLSAQAIQPARASAATARLFQASLIVASMGR